MILDFGTPANNAGAVGKAARHPPGTAAAIGHPGRARRAAGEAPGRPGYLDAGAS